MPGHVSRCGRRCPDHRSQEGGNSPLPGHSSRRARRSPTGDLDARHTPACARSISDTAGTWPPTARDTAASSPDSATFANRAASAFNFAARRWTLPPNRRTNRTCEPEVTKPPDQTVRGFAHESLKGSMTKQHPQRAKMRSPMGGRPSLQGDGKGRGLHARLAVQARNRPGPTRSRAGAVGPL